MTRLAKDKRENLLILGLFLMESLENKDGMLKINGEEHVMIDYSIVYGESVSVLNIVTKIKNIILKILRTDEKYIIDKGNVLTLINSENKLVTLKC